MAAAEQECHDAAHSPRLGAGIGCPAGDGVILARSAKRILYPAELFAKVRCGAVQLHSRGTPGRYACNRPSRCTLVAPFNVSVCAARCLLQVMSVYSGRVRPPSAFVLSCVIGNLGSHSLGALPPVKGRSRARRRREGEGGREGDREKKGAREGERERERERERL